MKICYTGDAKSIHMQKWASWFIKRGHEVHVITSSSAKIDGAKTYVIGNGKESSRLNFLKKILQTRRLVRKIKPDILHAHYAFNYGSFGALSRFHPFVLTAWGTDILIEPKKSFYRRQLIKYALKKADLITCDAEHMKKAMMNLRTDLKKVDIIYFGIDTEKFSPKQTNKKIREVLGVFNSPMIISLRNLEPVYDIESLIASIPPVLKEFSEAKFVIAGRGAQEEMLKELAKSLGVSNSIRFIGLIPNDELSCYLTASDVYVSTSLSDAGLSASTAEAMACGVPVIITDFGANREWVKDGESGFVVPLKDPESLAKKIIVLLKDRSLQEKFGRKGRQIIKERLDYHNEMSKMEKKYEEMIEK